MKIEEYKLFVDICMDMWTGDCQISYNGFVEEITNRINNLSSSVGNEAHEKLEALGVVDETGLTWEEEDKYTKEQISGYENLLTYLQNDSNWTL